jgi:SulP family sulfate permease
MLRPKLFDTLKTYDAHQFTRDLMAGLIVGIVALPLAIAFAIASGVSPEKGLYTAIIAGFLISALGGSRVQIGGPTGAFVVIIYGIVQRYGIDGLMVATIIAGVILILMGLFKFGSIIKFIPHPVIVGFTTGIAVIIFSSQVNDLLGLGLVNVPSDFIEKWIAILGNAAGIHLNELLIGGGVILVVVLWPKVTTRIPSPFVAIIAASVTVAVLKLPVDTIGTRFGDIPHSLPMPSWPEGSWSKIRDLIQPGMTIALLAGIESLLSAVVADGMISGKHRSNMELVAQGIANIASPIFGGIPATGAIARTATNVKNGGRTPVAGMVHAVVLLLIMLLFGKWAAYIPMAALAGIMMVVAYNMSEWRSFVSLARARGGDALVLGITFMLTVVVDLTVAIQIGVLVAAVLFLKNMSSAANVTAVTKSMLDEDELEDPADFTLVPIPEGVRVFQISGPMFFGAAYKFKEAMSVIEKPPKVIVIRMRKVPLIDGTGIRTLEDVFAAYHKRGTVIVLSGVHPQVLVSLQKAGLVERIGEENMLPTFDDALLHTRKLLDRSVDSTAKPPKR